MLDILDINTDFIMLNRVEPALYDARRLLAVASLPCVTMELASPVLDAAANHLGTIVEAMDATDIPAALCAAIEEADGAMAEAVAAVADVNQGGGADEATTAIAAAMGAVETLIGAATAWHEAMRAAA